MSLILGEDLCVNATVPSYLPFFTASSSILISIIASVGNSLVVIAVIWNPYKDLRTPFCYFVANLSIADLVVGLIVGPLSTINHILKGLDKLKQPFGDIVLVAYFILCTASLFSLSALALDRYLAIMNPLSYRTNLNPVRTFLVSVIVWIASILLSMIFFIVGPFRYLFIFANTALAVTIVVLIFTKAKILKYLRHQTQQWDTFHESTEENLIMRQLMMWEKKMTKTLLIVMLLFLTFYLPSCIFIYIINLCTNCHCVFLHWIIDIQFLLIMANSAVNPFVFPWRLGNFRRVFRSIVTCRTCIRSMSVLNHNNYQPL
ncbi:adrenocorticotropic hormone receptor-like [Orbicella faveolata]|uniref:adrenocorticotropic hormone receptor-like n=1 Tax=Orbicella faveolata TaxID=48498 RepID=UPI0009E37749|nr:adrenocorticotropic hormone receptor-like [Orbicella faveolata]XP_020615385.1 adrenocorticotropic hormone receptor-like [Orbicella faveolata]